MTQGWARRKVLAGGAMGALGLLAPGAVWAGAGAGGTSDADAAFGDMLERFAGQILRLDPGAASQLGLDHGPLAGLRSRLRSATPGALDHASATIRAIHQDLGGVARGVLSPANQLRYDTLRYALERGLEGVAFTYGGGALAGVAGGTAPYVVSQQNGAVSEVPEMLVTAHVLAEKADADAYLERVSAFARLIGEEAETIRADGARGVVPPAFIAQNALGILRGFRAIAPADQRLVTHLAGKTAALGLAGYGEKAAKIVESQVYPALDKQIAALAAVSANAPTTAGVQHLPAGDAYYAWALRLGTTTPLAAAEIHKIGLAQNEEIKARMDALLKAQGLTQGSVGARVTALNADPRFLYPDTDEGRAALIAYLTGRLDAARALMPRLSHMQLKADVTVKRVPPEIQDGAALGYMQPAALDGSRPAIYYVNLKTTKLWPRYQLATLTAHEGIPGHTWQLAYLAEHHGEVPAIASITGFNAFVEGWALYAEQLVDESGLYDADPWSRLGYLQAQQFRACRLVADTGLHAMGWSREQAVAFLCEETGKGREAMTSETDRYCASPGQACGYKMGHNELIRLREKARAALGPRFDLAAYNDLVVRTGGVPLELLEGVVDGYLAGARA